MSSDPKSEDTPSTAVKKAFPSPPPPPASATPTRPDAATRKAPNFTEGAGEGQIFHFSKFGISYGTDDKTHAAAIVLGVAILIVILLLALISLCANEGSVISEILKTLGTAFLLVVGVAIGRSSGGDKRESDRDV